MTVNVRSSTDNIKQIQAQFNEVISYSQGFEPDTDELFARWYEAKRDYIEAFGGNLIWECPNKVTFELSQADKKVRLDDFINKISTTFGNDALANFLEDNREGFFTNEVVESGFIHVGTGDVVEIPTGMKLIKAFKYFENDPITLKDLQTHASMIIQEDKVTGTLCISVHPLDFLSSSENTYNWRSCHALDGEYRAGNFSYMMDKSTIMCYLKGADDAKLPNFPDTVRWNSKKWRMLLFFSDRWDVMFAGRQYPFFSKTALDIIAIHLKNKLTTGYWSEWHNDELKSFTYSESNVDGGSLMWNYICLNNELYKTVDIIQDGKYSLHFNDLLRSSCYTPYYSFKYYRPIGETPKVHVGAAAPCLMCGRSHMVSTDSLLCEECELEFGNSQDDRYGYCDCCDRRIVIEDAHFIESVGQLVCEWCYDSLVTRCEKCGNDFFNTDLTYDKDIHSYVCCNCASHRNQKYVGSCSSIADDLYVFDQQYQEVPKPLFTAEELNRIIDAWVHEIDILEEQNNG